MLKQQRGCRSLATVVCLLFAATAALAQDAPAPRTQIYGGYNWYDPGARLNGTTFPSLDKGFAASGAYFLNRYIGFSLGTSYNWSDPGKVTTVMAGPVVRAPSEAITPFAEFLVGWHRVDVPGGSAVPENNGVGIAAGGGLDLNITKRLAIRLIQADYVYAHHNYNIALASRNWSGARVGGGIVYKIGDVTPPVPPSASCSAQPTEVFAGEPITVTANAANFPKNRTLTYNWSS